MTQTFQRRLILPAEELLGYLNSELGVYLGPAVNYCNFFEFIECVINEIICDSKALDPQDTQPFMRPSAFQRTWIQHSKTPDELLSEYGIPTDIVYTLYARIKHTVERQIFAAFGGLTETMDYQFYLYESGDVVIEEYLPTKPRQSPTAVSPPIDEYIESVRRGLDNGDWYPENIRRLVRGP